MRRTSMMSFASHADISRVVTSQTSPMATPKISFPNSAQYPGTRCCETGRPVALDPVTGSTVCSCQLKAGVPAYLSRVPSLPETVYGTGNGHLFQPNVVMGSDATAALYHMGMKSAERQTENGVKAGTHGVHSPYYLDQIMAAQSYSAFYSGLDINGARRKNATRETTSALKAWLYEHRKNPYPTKGEKIMLAIITRMTLTQVSTWFANARRRLKKENRLDGKEDDLSDIEIDDIPMKKITSTSGDQSPSNTNDGDHRRSPSGPEDMSDISDEEDVTCRNVPTRALHPSLYSPEQPTNFISDTDKSPVGRIDSSPRHVSKYVNCDLQNRATADPTNKQSRDNSTSVSGNVASKPKIWSISEIISSRKEDDANTK